jgi:hypothetical protein
MYFSEEIKNTRKLDLNYAFSYKSGYLFDKKDIFAEFINDIYEIKKNHNKDDP